MRLLNSFFLSFYFCLALAVLSGGSQGR
uniref:Uncharacterized protein n=1 Tax=Rhizophora mucronata TaxID=61149 RepID=A0A2P2NCL2_RHIMU